MQHVIRNIGLSHPFRGPLTPQRLWRVVRCPAGGKATVQFQVKKRVQFGHRVGIVGEPFGQWAPEKALLLDWGDGDLWASASVDIDRNTPLEYKFAVLSGGKVVEWQPGPNLTLDLGKLSASQTSAVTVEALWEGPVKVLSKDPGAALASSTDTAFPGEAHGNEQAVEASTPDTPASASPSDLPEPAPQRQTEPAAALPVPSATDAPTVQAGMASGAGREAAELLRQSTGSPKSMSEVPQEKKSSITSSSISASTVPSTSGSSTPDRDALERLKVGELTAALRELGLPVSGRKADLISRLRDASVLVAESPAAQMVAPSGASRKALVKASNVESWTVEALREELRKKGLQVSGRKAELVERLRKAG